MRTLSNSGYMREKGCVGDLFIQSEKEIKMYVYEGEI